MTLPHGYLGEQPRSLRLPAECASAITKAEVDYLVDIECDGQTAELAAGRHIPEKDYLGPERGYGLEGRDNAVVPGKTAEVEI